MKNFLNVVLMGLVGVTLWSGCRSTDSKSTSSNRHDNLLKEGTIVHSVYFWLRDDLAEEEREDFLNFFEALKYVPGLASYHIGTPAATTDRDVVDNSFSYHWLTTFASLEDIALYENHPDHLDAVEKYSKYWIKVEVKDSVL